MIASRYDAEKIRKMRIAGRICADILKQLSEASKVGVSLLELDKLAGDLCKKNAVKPAFKGFEGFPANVCLCPNDIVEHGIPVAYDLQDGDLLSIDMGVIYEDIYSDTSTTIGVGNYSEDVQRMIDTVKKATMAGINMAVPGNRVGDISHAIQTVVEDAGYSVVRELVGHGVGYELHEEPNIPGYGKPGKGEFLYKGQTLAIETIMNQGGRGVFLSSDDGWTIYTKDGMLSALFEHTIVVDIQPEILTKW